MTIVKIHIDAIGGIAGDMFVAAMLNLRPELLDKCKASVEAIYLSGNVEIELLKFNDSIIEGKRFIVTDRSEQKDDSHVHWSVIKDRLLSSVLSSGVKDIAIKIFSFLAQAEAEVHGIDRENVAFHDVGAVDSIVDVVCAATIIDHFSGCGWTIGPLPLGSGTINSQHGILPVPAPATILFLKGFVFVDDGE